MSLRLVKSDFVPPKPVPLGEGLTPSRRRGALSFATHSKLTNKLYVRHDDDAESTVIRLPAGADRPEISETGEVFFTNKGRKRVCHFDRERGQATGVLELEGLEKLWSLHAVGDDVVWIWRHVQDVSEGQLDTWINTIERHVRTDDGWRCTHTVDPGGRARNWTANRDQLVVLVGSPTNAMGTPTLYRVPEVSETTSLERVGQVHDWFDYGLEWHGGLWLRAWSEPGHSWRVELRG